MPPEPDTLVAVAALALAAGVLYLNLWRAVLFVAPSSLFVDAEAPADQMKLPELLAPLEAELLALGFARLGSRVEKPKLTRETLSYDYGHSAEKVFATCYLSRRGAPRVYFLTVTESGEFALTANHRRLAREQPGRYFSGWLEDRSLARIFKAHQRRAASLGAAAGRFDAPGRLELARRWFRGPGRVELRLQNLYGLLWTLGSLGMVGAVFLGRR